MSDVTLFKGKFQMPVMPQDFVDPVTDAIAGGAGGGGGRRISIRGKAFRQIVGSKEVHVSEDNTLDVVLIHAAPVSRMYYAGEYKEGEAVAPTCWSSDTQTPDNSVPKENRQASRCADCPNNVKGSGSGDSRACRFSQRVAVVLDGELDNKQIYQLQLPATSVFGDSDGTKMPLQAYGRYLKANNANAVALVTRMKFDIKATQPKLFFSAIRPLEQEELDICLSLRDHPDTLAAVTLTVGQTDGAKPAAIAAPAKKATPAVDEDDEDEDDVPVKPAKKAKKPIVLDEDDDEDEVAEPVKATKKKTPAVPEVSNDLADLMDEWDD